jgi:hypothetical protein
MHGAPRTHVASGFIFLRKIKNTQHAHGAYVRGPIHLIPRHMRALLHVVVDDRYDLPLRRPFQCHIRQRKKEDISVLLFSIINL